MELDWSTFALQIVNFLVLVWLLKRFLYQPVMNTIAQRKAGIEKALTEAEAMRREAQTLRDQYEHRLADWEQEKEKARSRLREELNAERSRLQAELRASLDQEREKARVQEARRLDELARHADAVAIAQAAQFVSRLLARLAGPALQDQIIKVVLEDLRALPKEQQQAIRDAVTTEMPVAVTSAYALSRAQREALAEALQELTGRSLSYDWQENPELIAGVRLSVGPWMLRANLQDELSFFTEMVHGAQPTRIA